MEDLETRAKKIWMNVAAAADDDDVEWIDKVHSKKCSVVDDDDDHGIETHHDRYPLEKTVYNVLMEKAM